MMKTFPPTAGRLSLGIVILVALVAGLYIATASAQATCPTTLLELEQIIDDEADPIVRAEAAECFVENAIDLSYQELKNIVHKMLKDEDAADVRFHGLAMLGASLMTGQSIGADLTGSKAKIIGILEEDPVGRNKAAAAVLIGEMDPIPVNRVETPLLDLLSHSDSAVAKAALDALLRFQSPPHEEISQSLLGKMGHSNPRQRSFASRGLGLIHRNDPGIDPALVDALAAALSDSDRYVKIQAAHSLMLIGPQAASAVPDLRVVAWDPKQPPAVRRKAQEAEEAITGEPTQAPWSGDPPPSPPPGYSGAQ